MSGSTLEYMMATVSIILLIIYTALGTFGNSMTLIVVWRIPTLSTPINFFIINLAIADLIISIIVNPLYIITIIYNKWPFGGMLCNVVRFLTIWSCVCSALNLAAIAYNRYVCILKPSRYTEIFTKKRTLWMCFAVWGFAFLPVLVPAIAIGSRGYNDQSTSCSANRSDDADYWKYFTTVLLIIVIIIASIIVFCYVKIIRKVSASMKTTRSSKLQRGDTGRVSAKLLNNRKKEYNLAKNIMVVSTTFMICWAPMCFVSIARVSGAIIPQQLWQVTVLLILLNSAINPIIYAWRNKYFRKAYLQTLCKRTTTANVQT
ncbi:melatonin receptor type 1A-like [Anneissia japonica]|uniref:melatonin receptor type 1A-like n=1 Tax=Anneissia japonica TaxID=1529436 RepID=UPI0014257F82|nr:melatonin receptor type 1A-like [Anneissia japonica]